MLERFLQFIKKHALFDEKDKLLVAVSGGVDSMVLCDLLIKSKFDIGIAHCNFQLRREYADRDEAFVQAYAESYKVPFYSTRFDTKAYAKENGISTQMAARDLRYSWFRKIMKKGTYNRLVTAHHVNDIAETILLNITRGTSINGVAGIPMSQNDTVRPLLSFTKSELLGYAINNEIKWREDASNKSTNYRRNKIRHEVVPILQEINPSFLKQAQRFAEKNEVVKQLFAKHMHQLEEQLLKKERGVVQISKEELKNCQVSAFELEELLHPYGFNYDQSVAVLDTIEGLSGTKFETESHELIIDRKYLLISERRDRENVVFEIAAEDSSFETDVLYAIQIKEQPNLVIDTSPENAMLDFSKLKFPLTMRRWQQGDRFKPLGMKGEKLVSDYLIDQKIPLSEKDKVMVLTSEDQIVWLVGHRISNDFKITEESPKVLHIQRQA